MASVPNVSSRSTINAEACAYTAISLPSSHPSQLPLPQRSPCPRHLLFPILPTARLSLQLLLPAQPALLARPLLLSPSPLPQCRPPRRLPTAPLSQPLPRALPQLHQRLPTAPLSQPLLRALPQLRQRLPTARQLPTAPLSRLLPLDRRQLRPRDLPRLRQRLPTARPRQLLPRALALPRSPPLRPALLHHRVLFLISPPARPSPPSRVPPAALAAPSPWLVSLLSLPSFSHRLSPFINDMSPHL